MSKNLVTRSEFVPAPIDGVNLIAPPQQLKQTEARVLDNYYVYDWGVRERATMVEINTPFTGAITHIHSFVDGAGDPSLLISSSSASTGPTIYKLPYGGSWTSLDTTASNTFYDAFTWNHRVFMPQFNRGEVSVYDINTGSFSASSFTMGGVKALTGFAYKSRAYFIDYGTAEIHYGDVAAVSGSLTSAGDFSQILQKDRMLTWGTSWNYNQGNINEELFVVGGPLGEILIYAGDYPAAPNWTLIARLEIPKPYSHIDEGQLPASIVRVGQDILIVTRVGLISLSEFFAGRAESGAYSTISRKIGPVLLPGVAARSPNTPFAYFIGAARPFDVSADSIYALNVERGAWSRIVPTSDTDNVPISVAGVACLGSREIGNGNFDGRVFIWGDTGDGYSIWTWAESRRASLESFGAFQSDPNATYKLHTRYFDFGRETQKCSKMIRVVARDHAANSIYNSVSIAVDFDDATEGDSDSGAITVTDTYYKQQELAPPGIGRHLSYMFAKTGSVDRQNEIAGFTATFEEGGSY